MTPLQDCLDWPRLGALVCNWTYLELIVWLVSYLTEHVALGCQFVPDYDKMGQICEFLRSVFMKFWFFVWKFK